MNKTGRTKYYILMEIMKQAILNGTIKAGEKLLSENELAKKYEVSRHTVRRALSLLIEEGYVTAQQGRGNFCIDRFQIEKTKRILLLVREKESVAVQHLLLGMKKELFRSGYELLIESTDNNVEKERYFIQKALDRKIDGLIIEPSKSEIVCSHQQLYETLRYYGIPYLFIQGVYPGMRNQDCILKDDYQAGYLATRYLIRQGHKKIVGIFSSDDHQGIEQHKGYVKALEKVGISYHPEFIIWFHEEDRWKKPWIGVEELLKNNVPVEGIICQTDRIARELMKNLEIIGKKIPEDISIIGNDLVEGKQKNLTMIFYHQQEIGEKVATILLHKIENKRTETVDMVIPPKLIIGRTTKSRRL